MGCKRFLYAIVSLVLLMHTVAAVPVSQIQNVDVVQALVTAAQNAGYTVVQSQVQTNTLSNGGSVANYPLVASVDASNLPAAGVLVALQYWASPDLTGFILVVLTSANQQTLQFALLDSTNTTVGTQTVPATTTTTTAAAVVNQNAVRADRAVVIVVTLCVGIGPFRVCVTWTIILNTPVAPPPKPIAPKQPVAPVNGVAN